MPGSTSGMRTFTVAFSPSILTFSRFFRSGAESALRAAFFGSPPRASTRLAVRAALETCV